MYTTIKKINGHNYFYLIHNVRLDRDKWKKITLYVGKNLIGSQLASIPKSSKKFMLDKEIEIRSSHITEKYDPDTVFTTEVLKEIEQIRVKYGYYLQDLDNDTRSLLFSSFMADFIYESNALEGSKVPLKDVKKIINHKKPSKMSQGKGVLEVLNSIKTFDFTSSRKFKWNHKFILNTQKILLEGVSDVAFGYRKSNIIVGNSEVSDPKKIKNEMADLMQFYKKNKNSMHPLKLAFTFHKVFERIHPFVDGNGRCGRILMNKILIGRDYPPLIVRNNNRAAYFNAFEKATQGRDVPLTRFLLKCFKETYYGYFLTV
jgi:Fic family protein